MHSLKITDFFETDLLHKFNSISDKDMYLGNLDSSYHTVNIWGFRGCGQTGQNLLSKFSRTCDAAATVHMSAATDRIRPIQIPVPPFP